MKRKLFAGFLSILFIVLVIMMNIVAHQYNRRVDLTKFKQHTLSEETLDVFKHLKEKVTITALHVGMPPKYLEDMLREYERLSNGWISTKIIDPLVDIGYAAQFGNIITGKQKKVVVQSQQERRDIDFTDDVLTEELLTNGIIRVVRQKQKACFLLGHNEYKINSEEDQGFSIFHALLSTNNFDLRELLLEEAGGVPQECDVLVVAGPKKDLRPKEYNMIDMYLKQGGDALFLVEHVLVTTPDKPLTQQERNLNPSMNTLLNKWGIKINNDIVVDLESHASGDVGSPATNNYLSHRAIVSGLDYTFYIRPRSISIYPDRRKSLKVAPLVLTQSASKSWGETDRMLNVNFDNVLDRPGPVPLAFVIWEEKSIDESSDTRIIVFTDADFLSNAYIGAYSNAQLGLNSMNWLTEVDFKAFKAKKTIDVERLDLLSHQKQRIRLILILMPVLILVSGLSVWLLRR